MLLRIKKEGLRWYIIAEMETVKEEQDNFMAGGL